MAMKRMTRGIAILALAACAVAGCSTYEKARRAQEASEAKSSDAAVAAVAPLDLRGYSLERLVAFALTNRPSVVTARLAVEDARLKLWEESSEAPLVSRCPWGGPQTSIQGAHNESSAGTTYGNSDFQTVGSPSAGLSLELLLWDFGRYDAKYRGQCERILSAEQALVDEGYAVFLDVATAYFTYFEKRALHNVALKNEREYADHLHRAEERLKAGEANRLDVLKARLDLAKATETVVSVSNLVVTSGAELMGALGVDVSRGACTDVLGPVSDALGQVRQGFVLTNGSDADLFAFARTNAPAMRVARAQLRAASADVDNALADMLPKVSASVGLSWANPLWYFSWGFSAAQSLFSGITRTKEPAAHRKIVALESASAAVDRAEQELSVSIETAVADRDNSIKAIETAKASVASAKENLEMVRQQLEVGAVSRIELSEAISSHSTALGSCITAFYEGQMAEAKLFQLTGRYPVYRERIVEAH